MDCLKELDFTVKRLKRSGILDIRGIFATFSLLEHAIYCRTTPT